MQGLPARSKIKYIGAGTVIVAIIAIIAVAASSNSKNSSNSSDSKTGITSVTTNEKSNCDPSYPDVCIPPSPPDLDCKDIQYRNFRVLPPDPHRFDGDHDGIGCVG